ncbi:MAG: cyclic nucleotide-binding domain-containing protein [Micavibrio aeruginosavorus]|nr:cyclic nucleotide-binding domain-containing protein [Micavibrio aeruginosavorus]
MQIRDSEKRQDDNAPLFIGLTEDSIQTLLSNSFMQNFSAGKQLIQQGDTPTHLYFIIEGSIKTVRYSTEGEEATIRMLQAGETFMDAVIFMGGKSPINALTLEDSRFLMIPAEAVRRHALHDAQFACNLLRIVTKHYKNAMQQIDSIITKNPVERLGYYFLKQHLEQDPQSMDIALPFQKSTIANHLGMTPETFSRALAQIKKMGIDVDQEKLTLRDAYALCHFCDPDTAHSCPKFETDFCPLHSDCKTHCH